MSAVFLWAKLMFSRILNTEQERSVLTTLVKKNISRQKLKIYKIYNKKFIEVYQLKNSLIFKYALYLWSINILNLGSISPKVLLWPVGTKMGS